MGKPAFNRKSMSRYHQGYYKIVNPDKYVGNPGDIQYRSSYERSFCYFCDFSPRVKHWASENIKIPYKGLDNKTHTYYMDYYVEFHTTSEDMPTVIWLVEVKDSKEVTSEPPKPPLKESVRAMNNYMKTLKTWGTNQMKWAAAKQYAESRGWHFRIITEHDLTKLSASIR